MGQESRRKFFRKTTNGEPISASDWLAQMHDWRSDHRRAMAKLARLQAMLLHLDANLEESFLDVIDSLEEQKDDAAKTNDHDELERTLLEAIDCAERQQAQAIEAFDHLIAELEAIQQEVVTTLPSTAKEPERLDDVEEASWESFPASDSPSYNPGRA